LLGDQIADVEDLVREKLLGPSKDRVPATEGA
jgi:hypothetical protein